RALMEFALEERSRRAAAGSRHRARVRTLNGARPRDQARLARHRCDRSAAAGPRHGQALARRREGAGGRAQGEESAGQEGGEGMNPYCRRLALTSPRLRGEVELRAQRAIRVRGPLPESELQGAAIDDARANALRNRDNALTNAETTAAPPPPTPPPAPPPPPPPAPGPGLVR